MLAHRIRQTLKLIRLKPFDESTEQGRSQERLRRAALSALTSGVARLISQVSMLISVPLTLTYLGSERYGLWTTVSFLVMMLGFTDLGIGLGLVNQVASAIGRDDRAAVRTAVSSATFMLFLLAAAVMGLFLIAYPFVPWPAAFNVKTALASAECGPAARALMVCFCITMVVSVVQRVQYGMQLTFVANVWQCAGSLLGLGALLAAIWMKAGLVWLLVASMGGPILLTALNGVTLFGREKWMRPSIQGVSRGACRQLLGTGVMFVILQITVALAFQSDNIVIAQLLGADAVPQYSVPYRLFFLAPAIVNMALGPLWPAYGEALARGDVAWCKRTFRRSLFLGVLITTPPSLVLMLFGKTIIHWWVGSSVDPSWHLLLGMGLWAIVFGTSQPVAMLLNGMGAVKFQVVLNPIFAVTNLGLSIVLTRAWGVSGVVYGTLFTLSTTIMLPCILYIPRLLESAAKSRAATGPSSAAPAVLPAEGASTLPAAPTDPAAMLSGSSVAE